MLKKIAKRINKEIEQARDYCEQAYLVKTKNSKLADLFATLAEEELVHAEKLLKEGRRLISDHEYESYSKEKTDNMSADAWKEKCEIIWEWEHRIVMGEVLEIRYKLSEYRGM